MVAVIRRMHKLKALLSIRHGPGAAVLPAGITRIHMEFAHKGNEGHYGPRKFWRLCLPRLKFWNPAIPMIVNRTREQSGAATMSIYFRQGQADPTKPTQYQEPSSTEGLSKAPSPDPDEKVVTIEMKNQHSDQILKEFLEKTGAVPVVPTPQEELEIQEVEEMKERAAIDRENVRQFITKQRREAAMMAQARNEAAALKAAT